jgi:hypothetical protein
MLLLLLTADGCLARHARASHVACACVGAYPSGEADEELGMTSISLKKLLRNGSDLELTPLRLTGVEGEKMGTVTCAVHAVGALTAIGCTADSGRGGAAVAPTAMGAPAGAMVAPVAMVAPGPPAQPALPPRQTFRFGPGSLGLVLLDHPAGVGGVLIKEVDGSGQGGVLGVPAMSTIVAVRASSSLQRDALPAGAVHDPYAVHGSYAVWRWMCMVHTLCGDAAAAGHRLLTRAVFRAEYARVCD